MAVVEIRCPSCGELDAVVKVGVGAYRCRDCGTEFAVEDVTDGVG
jgi:ribosomal protein L37AE/L43A